LLPMPYFEAVKPTGERGRFDPKSIDFDTQFEAAKPLLARTRDLRLLVLLAKFSILSRNLDDFIKCLKAISFLLQEQWDAVHPRGEDGDFSYRGVIAESIDVYPTVVYPLQFLPLIENRRHGTLNYRAYLIAKGEIPATDDETDKLDLSTIERIIREADLALLKTLSATFADLAAVLAEIQT
ncbi:type VI secretion system ImpA family N-terminal domain-containing protein, partial [Lactobacillus crispatus]|uniref:type VI secretion system ImpA family N-terminal domain-containing protein n=1 Tax=Lactobacillus crispatus TaxID=47770 RepID=UPI0010D1C633